MKNNKKIFYRPRWNGHIPCVYIFFQLFQKKNFQNFVQTFFSQNFCFIWLPHWGSYVFVKFFFRNISLKILSLILSLKLREIWFLAGVRMYVCVCVCVRFSTFQTPITHKRLEISIWNLVYQWSNHKLSIVTIFMRIDARFVILWDFEFFEKRTW